MRRWFGSGCIRLWTVSGAGAGALTRRQPALRVYTKRGAWAAVMLPLPICLRLASGEVVVRPGTLPTVIGARLRNQLSTRAHTRRRRCLTPTNGAAGDCRRGSRVGELAVTATRAIAVATGRSRFEAGRRGRAASRWSTDRVPGRLTNSGHLMWQAGSRTAMDRLGSRRRSFGWRSCIDPHGRG